MQGSRDTQDIVLSNDVVDNNLRGWKSEVNIQRIGWIDND